jgi:hypothetical protein
VKVVFTITLYYLQQLGARATMAMLDQIKKEEWIVGNLFDVIQAFLNLELDPDKKSNLYSLATLLEKIL